MDYSINPSSSGTYTTNLRIANPNTGAQLQIKKSDGTVLSTVNLPNTWGWQEWQTTATTVTLAAGVQTIRIQSSAAPGWNINWLEFVQTGVTNQTPTANAGTDQTITLPVSTVTLSGSGADVDGSIVSYVWSKVSGGTATITSSSSASTTVTGLAQGSYTFRLTVTDNGGATASDDVVVIVNALSNQTPTANAGTDQTITLPVSTVTLSGSGADVDGSIVSYAWSKVSGGTATITSSSSASTTVTGLAQGSYTFRLTVTDNGGATASDDVVVIVNALSNQTPTANAGTDQTITLPVSTVTLSGSGADVDGSIVSYVWSKVSGGTATITSSSSASTTVTGLAQGSYTFRLTVTDNGGATASDDVIVTVNTSTSTNQSPTVNAGADQTITLPANSVQLTGSAGDPDGSIASYSWSKLSGPAEGTISNASIANPIVNGLTQGTYTFRLTATDNGGASASDDVVITVRTSSASSSSFKIEAENYTAMSGVQTEITKDTSGGLNVGWIEQGDWMDYSINPSSAGTYTINLRIANPNTGAQLQIKKSDGTVLSTVNLPNTWGWQEWQTTATTVTLAAGVQTIRIQSSAAPGWNINWLEVVGGTAGGVMVADRRELQLTEATASSVGL